MLGVSRPVDKCSEVAHAGDLLLHPVHGPNVNGSMFFVEDLDADGGLRRSCQDWIRHIAELIETGNAIQRRLGIRERAACRDGEVV